METPTLHMHTLKIAVLEPDPSIGEPPIEWVRSEIARRLHLLPPLRRRVVEVPFGLSHPVWIEDPDLDVDYHVRRVQIAPPGGYREMNQKISELASRPLDRSRPLWEMYLLAGLEGGRIAVLVKIHHAAADGVAAAELLMNVMASAAGAEVSDPDPEWRGEAVPTSGRLMRDAIGEQLRQIARLPMLLLRTLRNMVALLRHRRSADVHPPLPILDTPRTSFNTALTPHRVFTTTSLSLPDVKAVRAAFGVTVNDVVLAVVGGAMRGYLDKRGELPDRPLVAGVPVSTDRPGDDRRLGGNKVSNLFTTLATDQADPVARLRAVHAITSEAKIVQTLFGEETLADWVQYTPPKPYAWFMRQYSRLRIADHHPPPINLVVSNVPGPREPLFAGGARLVELYSVGPILEGIGVNVTVWSYLDQLYVGLLGCRETLPDADSIVEGMHAALDELVEAASATDAVGV